MKSLATLNHIETKLIVVLFSCIAFGCGEGFKTVSPQSLVIGSSITPVTPADPAAAASCTFYGSSIASDTSVTAFSVSSVAFNQSCSSYAITVKCSNGVLSPANAVPTCAVTPAASCSFNGTSIASGSSPITAFQTSSVPFGQTCVSQMRSCTDGVLSGSFTAASCAPAAGASCNFNGQQISSGSPVTAYQTSSVLFGQICASESRVCTNGTLSGSFSFGSCSPAPAASCNFNGTSYSSGQSFTAYLNNSDDLGPCVSETRTCLNGSITGSYPRMSCSSLTYKKLANVVQIAAGDKWVCALIDSGIVKCLGSNIDGVLGNGTFTDSNIPVIVSGLSGVKSIAGYDGSMCALINNGHVKCWGRNEYGELGNGTVAHSNVPTDVKDITTFAAMTDAVTLSNGGTCAISQSGQLKCWGSLGPISSEWAMAIPGMNNMTSVSSSGLITCGIDGVGDVYCFGSNQYGQLTGGAATYPPTLTPYKIAGLSNIAMISSDYLNCALSFDGVSKCWGGNPFGALGNGTVGVDAPTPVVIPNLTTNQQYLMSHGLTTIAIDSSGKMSGWGYLQDNFPSGPHTTPVAMNSEPTLQFKSAAVLLNSGICALTTTGNVRCWGSEVPSRLYGGQSQTTHFWLESD